MKLGTLFMLQIGRTKINGMFRKTLCSKKRSIFLFIIFPACYFAITSVWCIIFQCPEPWFLSQMCTLFVSSGLLILAYLVVAGIGHLLAISLSAPLQISQ